MSEVEPETKMEDAAKVFVTQRAKTRHDFHEKREEPALETVVSGIDQVSQSTLLLKKKKEMYQVDDALDVVKNEYNLRMEAWDLRQKKFDSKQKEMKENVTKFEKFVKENDAKRQRAEAKAKAERKMLEQKEAEQRKQMSEFAALERERTRQIAQLEKLVKYKEYLEVVVESAEDETAEEISDLINRHATLKNANIDLTDQVQNGDVEMDDLRNKMENLKLKTQSVALVQNSQINAKQKHLEPGGGKRKMLDESN